MAFVYFFEECHQLPFRTGLRCLYPGKRKKKPSNPFFLIIIIMAVAVLHYWLKKNKTCCIPWLRQKEKKKTWFFIFFSHGSYCVIHRFVFTFFSIFTAFFLSSSFSLRVIFNFKKSIPTGWIKVKKKTFLFFLWFFNGPKGAVHRSHMISHWYMTTRPPPGHFSLLRDSDPEHAGREQQQPTQWAGLRPSRRGGGRRKGSRTSRGQPNEWGFFSLLKKELQMFYKRTRVIACWFV